MRLSTRKLLTLGLALSVGFAAACDDDADLVGPTPTPEPPAVPSGIAVSATGPTSVQVSWTAVSGATGYVVERAPGASGGSFAQVGTPSSAGFPDTGVSAETTYRYRVAATGSAGTSAFSGEAVVTTPEPPAEGPKEATISANITADRTLFADTVYQLSGFVQVANGATLTIEAGTKIVADFDIPGSSLFVLRGSRIIADGTADAPIVFTSERPEGQRQPGDWGGLIIIGNGITNRGIPTFLEGTGTDDVVNPLQDYSGGTDNSDSSGILRYVRVEFAGFPTAPNEELNSITMAAVGSGTTIEFVQTLLGLDDGFEWFGGAVDAKYLISYETSDDHFDASEGFVGRLQYLIAFQSIRPEPRPNLAGGAASDPQGFENDGCWASNCNAGNDNRGASEPFTTPVFANFTLVGAPPGAWETPSGNIGMQIRRGMGGLYVNGVVVRYSRAGLSFRGQETMNRMDAGILAFNSIYFSGVNDVFLPGDPENASLPSRQFTADMAANNLEAGEVAPLDLFASIPSDTRDATGADFDWRPAAGSPIATGGLEDFSVLPQALQDVAAGAVMGTSYRGAADPNGPAWWDGWTNYRRF
ncbi:MAG: fibronectin type III domain-containing protein [Gemmatimonadota bacterium]